MVASLTSRTTKILQHPLYQWYKDSMVQMNQDAKDLKSEVDAVDEATDRLRATFEQYFQGIERVPPVLQRDALKRRLLQLRTTQVRNTAIRFRINQLVAKFQSYENYWNRILRQIEEGTYHRDVFKAKYRSKLREEPSPAKEGGKEKEGSDSKKKSSKRPSRRPALGLSDENVDAIYNAYVTAKRRCRENVKGLTRDALASSLKKQIPSIQKQYKCKTVEFKVVIKGGKAILKAVPKF